MKNHKVSYLVCVLFLVGVIPVSAATNKAMVITIDEKSIEGDWYVFRKSFNLKGDINTAELRIAADTKYWLWVNGELQVFEGGLKRGPTPGDGYIDNIKEIKGLKKRANQVSLLVWYYGKNGFSNVTTPVGGLYFDLKTNKDNIVSDASWKAIKYAAYYYPSNPKTDIRLSETNVGFDAQKAIEFQNPAFNDAAWKNARSLTLEQAKWGNLKDRPIPMFKVYEMKDYQSVKKEKDGTIVATLPYNAQVTPYIKVKAPAGKVITIKTDNYSSGFIAGIYSEYITRDGEQEYESLGWMNGHEVRYSLPEGVEMISVKYRESGYNTEFAGSFTCDDPFFNTLWEKGCRTVYINMRDNYMDCPHRERAQWWGDAVNETYVTYYGFDPEVYKLTAKAIGELMNFQLADSTISSPVPAVEEHPLRDELPEQMLASISYGFHRYLQYTNDKKTIIDVYTKIRKYIHGWYINNEDLVKRNKTGHDYYEWADWGSNIDRKVMYNMWYVIALNAYADYAILANDPQEAAWAKETASDLSKTIREKFWNGKFFVAPDYKVDLTKKNTGRVINFPIAPGGGVNSDYDDRCQALAVLAGVVKPEEYPLMREFFKKHFNASPYMEAFVLEALCRMGYYDDALDRMKIRYKDMVDSKYTTLWEGWDSDISYNHGWSSGPVAILSRYIAGIAPESEGFKTFTVSPQPAYLDNIKANVATLYGNIQVTIQKSVDKMIITLIVPASTEAELNMPSGYKKITINGRPKSSQKLAGGTYEIVAEK